MLNFYQHSIFSDDYHFVLFMQKLRKRLTLTSVLAGRICVMHALIGNVGDGNFRPSFYKKQYLSNGQVSCREISQKHCK